ncbi:MAG: ABC transporter ATP-binding protein, partial [Acutalibacteraceae bacterium]
SLAFVSKQVLDVATNHSNGNFYFYSLMLFAIIIPQILLNSVKTILIAVANGKLIISFRNHLFSYVVRKKYTEIAKHHSGDLLNRFTSDTDIVVTNTVSLLPSVASMVAQIVGGVLALILLDKRIAIIVFVFGITVPAFGRLINRKYIKLHKDCQETEGKSRSFMQECFENIVIIKSFISEAPITKKLNQLMYKNYKIKIKRSIISLVTHMGLYAFFTLGYFSVLIWGAGQISKGVITYGTLMAFLQVVGQLRAPMQNISGILPQYYSAIASAERLMEIEQGDKDLPPAEDESLNNLKQRFSYIEFDNVTFAYDDEPVLNDCSFVAKRGKITAITGESGSGKSTVLKIILGLYEPQSGRVTIDGETLLNTSHRGLFAYVPQGNLLLSGTIRENITLCDDSISNEEVMRAAKTAEIYDLINSMPEGLDTLLAERGAGLSEGQIQRISIARALLTNAPVLLLDEATSALDEATETKVLSNIRSFSDKTVLFVTHRNTSLKVCDKIIHIENKKFNVLKE